MVARRWMIPGLFALVLTGLAFVSVFDADMYCLSWLALAIGTVCWAEAVSRYKKGGEAKALRAWRAASRSLWKDSNCSE